MRRTGTRGGADRSGPRRRRGFLLIDATLGLLLLGVLTVTLAVLTHRHREADRRLADTRHAVRLAERVLIDLQHHRPPEGRGDPELSIDVEALPEPDPPTPGHRWVRVSVSWRQSTGRLIGLVPEPPRSDAP